MLKRIFALMLSAVLLLGLLAGCSKNQPDGTNEQSPSVQPPAADTEANAATSGTKYAYVPTYIDLPSDASGVDAICLAGDSMILSTSFLSGYSVDPDGNADAYQSQPKLYRLDLDTQEWDTVTAYAPPAYEPQETPDNIMIPALCAAPDGGFWALERTSSYPAPDGGIISERSGSNSYRLLHFAADGSLETELLLDSGAISADTFLARMQADSAGNVYLTDWQYIYIYSADGSYLGSMDGSDHGADLYNYKDGSVGTLRYTGSGALSFCTIDPARLAFGDSYLLPADVRTILPGTGEYDLYYESDYSVYGWNAATGVSEKVLDWLECDIDDGSIQNTAVLSDGRICAISYDFTDGTSGIQAVLLNRVDAASLPQKTELTLACMNLDWDLRSRIVKFNRESNQYRIVVKDYADYSMAGNTVIAGQSSDGITKLNTELLSGNTPDLLISSGLPVQQYAAKGLLEDLWQYIDADENVKRENLMTDVLNAAETDGRLYELPTSFTIVTAAGLGKVVGSYDSWTLDDLKDAMSKLKAGATVFSPHTTKNDMLTAILYMNADEFMDWQNKTCNFTSQDFIDYLNFADTFPDSYDWSGDYVSDDTRILSGEQLLTTDVSLYSLGDVYLHNALLGNDLCYVGFPSPSGDLRSCFQFSTSFSIFSASEHKDAAWSFLRSLLSDSYQSTLYSALPISRTAFEAQAASEMEQDYETDENGDPILDKDGNPIPIAKGGYSSDGSTMIDLYAMTQEQYDAVLALIHSTHRVLRYDESIQSIISAETASFFAGETTAEETASRIQNRVRLYIAEQS